MSEHIAPKKSRRVRFAPGAIAAGAIGALLLTVSLSGTLSGFTASINNSNDTASTGQLTMSETSTVAGTTTTCNSTDVVGIGNNAATCSTINKYGGTTNLVPGGSGVATTVTITNTGTVKANTFTMKPAACVQTTVTGQTSGGATDLCSQMTVVVTSGGTAVFSGTLAQFATATSSTTPALTMPVSTVAAGASVPFTFTVSLPSTLGNTYQNLQASQPILFTFGS
jgi:hypothetical protein